MQTFLPYRSFIKSAKCLDNRRLGKQRVEVLIILQTLDGSTRGWINHPVVKMWRGYEQALSLYGLIICNEWRSRKFKDNIYPRLLEYIFRSPEIHYPTWLGNEKLHTSHRSNLLRKHPDHYSKFGWAELDNLPYFWPI